jgi:hypothetical protein
MALHACAHHDARPLQHLEYEWRATRAYAQGKEFQVQQLIATRLPLMTCLACECSPRRPIGVPQVQQARRVTGAAKQRDAARCAIERVRQASSDDL